MKPLNYFKGFFCEKIVLNLNTTAFVAVFR